MAHLTLAALARHIGAELVPADGQDPDVASEISVDGVAGIEAAGPTQVTFVANPKYAALARTTHAAAVIVDAHSPVLHTTTLRTSNPYLAWSKAIGIFHPAPRYEPSVHPTAVIAATARVGRRAHIGAYVVIGEHCVLGEDAVLLPHVVLYDNVHAGDRFLAHAHAVVREGCRLGDDVVLQNGAIIGADGFGFARTANGGWSKILQASPAVLDDRVEVQANACVDRASIGETRIGAGTKIDNLVQVGHGSVVGKDTLLCSQVGLAGSTSVGDRVILAGQVGAAGHLHIGDGAVVTAQSGVPSDVAAGAVVSGYPAVENRTWLRTVAVINRLPELISRIRALEKKLGGDSER